MSSMKNGILIPKELTREISKLNLKEQRHSSTSSTSSRPHLKKQDSNNEIAIIDDSPQILATSIESSNELLPTLSHISLLSLRDEAKTPKKRNTSFSHSRVSSFHNQQRYQQFLRNSPIQSEPETPNFGPTSLNNSPSNFNLNSRNFIRSNSTLQPIKTGYTSPSLIPINDNDIPMTPLMLSNDEDL